MAGQGDEMPPMDNGNGEPPMGGEDEMDSPMPPMEGDGGAPEESEGSTVGKDVREYSGQLSQALKDYNDENPEDDEKLNKYAINMIAAQVADNLSDKDKRSVIKKLKGMGDDTDDELGEESQEDDMQMQDDNNPDLQLESYIGEVVSDILSSERHTKRGEKKVTNDKVSRKNPFVSKR